MEATMKSKTRTINYLFCVLSFLVLLSCNVVGQGPGFSGRLAQTLGDLRPLQIPPLIDSRESGGVVNLTLQRGTTSFFPGSPSQTFGFNGNFLGPAVRVYRGDTVSMNFTNQIGEDTTVHGHGLHVSGLIDGGPQQKIASGATWSFQFPVDQEASTSWYHPHLMGKTAEHVYKGLAGLYLIEDDNSQSLALPKEYGVDDIPLVVQDRLFDNGTMHYVIADMDDGYLGNVILVNGTVNPYLEVGVGLTRLRLLNGSNARFYNFQFSDGRAFQKIATDGGFLDAPVSLNSLLLAPGERSEIIVDFSSGKGVTLVTLPTLNTQFNDPLFRGNPAPVNVLEIRVNTSRTTNGSLPEKLNSINYYQAGDAAVTRRFHLNMGGDDGGFGGGFDDGDGGGFGDGGFGDEGGFGGGGLAMGEMMAINGRAMNMSYINERVTKGQLELWRVTGEEMSHPFHVHGTSFQVLSINGVPVKPEDRGWKDTVIVLENRVTEFLVRFDHEAADAYPYMYHCHILEHEDMGMMGQFTVKP